MFNETNSYQKSFLVVGRAGIDFYANPIGTKIEDATSFSAQLGGSAGNIAVGLAKQGVKSSLLTCVSNDAIGRFTQKSLLNMGVNTELIFPTSDRKNTLAVVDSNGEQTEAVIYRESAADLSLTKDITDKIDLSKYCSFITTGTALTKNPSREAVLSLMKRAKLANLEIIFDIDYREQTWSSHKKANDVLCQAGRLSDIVVGNNLEFDFMADLKEDGFSFAKSLHQNGPSVVIYKMGPKGCVLIANDEIKNFGIYSVNALKPTGAGDGFLAGFCASYKKHHDLGNAIQRGAATAALVVSNEGCSISMPTSKKLNDFMKTNCTTTVHKD